jgi:DNA topoisomerase IA
MGSNLVPTKLGYCLVDVYEKIKIELYRPTLRAAMEADMKCIAEGTRTRDQVYNECVKEMERIFMKVKGLET